jgi:hypothetical protein
MRERVLRMLVVTPQFAASAGLVIAAMLAIDMPHASLSYGPNPEINTCAGTACAKAKPPGHNKVTTTDGGIKLHQLKRPVIKHSAPPPSAPPSPPVTPAPTPTPTPTPGGPQVTLRYRVVHQAHTRSGFVAIITIHSHPPLRSDWALSFAFGDARIDHVWGATWHPGSAPGSVVVSGQPWPWPGQRSVSSRVVIFATGSASVPESCQFNGAPCTFS